MKNDNLKLAAAGLALGGLSNLLVAATLPPDTPGALRDQAHDLWRQHQAEYRRLKAAVAGNPDAAVEIILSELQSINNNLNEVTA